MTHFSVAEVQMPVSVAGNNIPAILQRANKIVHVHPWTRVRTHSQNMTMAARAQADKNTFGHLS